MRSGSVYGTAAMLDGMIERMEDELGESATVIATGGLGGIVIPHCRREVIYEKNLLLNGLWELYQKISASVKRAHRRTGVTEAAP